MEDLAGRTVKGYELRERIGAGGFGAVYRGYQSTVGREVAVKIILPGYTNHPDFIRRFEAEAQLVARLEHLHIAPLYDYWRDAEGAFLVMRYLRGGNLSDAIKRGPFDLESAAILLDQISSALSLAHNSNIIHRDIKPENILLDEDGNAYLVDFGIAKDVRLKDVSTTQIDAFLGSPDYIAPEQARREPVTARTDVYSLGIVLYEMLTGEHPFPNLTPVERLFKHLNDPIPKITAYESDVSMAINAVIQKATAKNPEQRYSDVRGFATAFREAAGLSVSRVARNMVELLTPREQQVLKLLIDGRSNREIAEALVVEVTTVKWYLYQIYRKLNVRSRVQAIVRARELNLIFEEEAWRVPSTTSLTGLPEPENPYRGLAAFQLADERYYFGREKLLQKLLARLGETGEHSRFLAIVGPSGSGKSSLVKAGLIPALWRGGLPDSERWFIVEMVPGERPLDELEIALMRIAAQQSGGLMEQLQRDEHGLTRAAKLILPDDGSELLVVIDQFEELFTLVTEEQPRRHFLGLLQAAVTDSRSRVRVVVTLRADFYDRPLQYPTFGRLVQSRTEIVLPLSAEELERAIVRPAAAVGVKFEEGLVASIVQDVHYQPGALPLMQYALTELFEHRSDHMLTHAGYEEIGGSVGALAKRIETLYGELPEDGQELVRQIFLRLVMLGEGVEDTRRRVLRSELLAIGGSPDLVEEVIDTFIASRLFAVDHDPETRSPTVELAHEAILREWGRLRNWLDESRGDIRLQRALASAADEWRAQGKDPSYLLRGMRLHQYEQWSAQSRLALTAREREFLDRCLEEREREAIEEAARRAREAQLEARRRSLSRGLTVALGAGLVVALGLSAFALSQRQSALRQASIGLAAQALIELEGTSPERAVLLALEALERYPYTPQAESALAKAVPSIVPTFSIGQTGGARFTTSASWSPDGKYLAIGSLQFAWIYDVAGPEEVLRFQSPDFGFECYVIDMSWSPTGDRIAMAIGSYTFEAAQGPKEGRCQQPRAGVWPLELDAPLWSLEPSDGEPASVDWSPDGSSLLIANLDGVASILSADSGVELRTLMGHRDAVTDAVWSTRGDQVLTVSWDGTATIWNSKSGIEVYSTPPQATRLIGAAWSPDGSRFAISGEDGLARIWDAKTGMPILALTGHAAAVGDVTWSPDGETIATMSADETVRLWDGQTGSQVSQFPSPRAKDSLAWSPDGTRLGAPGGYTLIGWRLSDRTSIRLSGHQDWVIDAQWSPSGSMIATTSNDQSTKLWDAKSGEELLALSPSGGFWMSWSPDGARLITAGLYTSGAEVWDVATGELVYAHQWPGDLFIWPAWSPDGSKIAVSTSGGSSMFIWDAETGEAESSFETGECPPVLPAWSPEGNRMATGCFFTASQGDNTPVSIWEAASGALLMTLNSDAGESIKGEWSPDGRYIVVGYELGVAKVWEVSTKTILTVFAGHTGIVWDVTWSPSGNRIASGDNAGNVKIWNAWTGEEVQASKAPSSVYNIDWSPTGDQLMAAGAFNTPLVFQVWEATEDLVADAYECCVFRELTPEERVQFGLPSE